MRTNTVQNKAFNNFGEGSEMLMMMMMTMIACDQAQRGMDLMRSCEHDDNVDDDYDDDDNDGIGIHILNYDLAIVT